MDGGSFEVACKVLWGKQGFLSYVTEKQRGDGGIDVVALRNPSGELIQCKNSAIAGNELGWDAVKEVTGGAARYQAVHPGVRFSKVAITNQSFNGTAQTQAGLNHVRLVEREELIGLLQKHPIALSEFDQEVLLTLERCNIA
jgi:HJR/Mrr/RecB family endonuclease